MAIDAFANVHLEEGSAPGLRDLHSPVLQDPVIDPWNTTVDSSQLANPTPDEKVTEIPLTEPQMEIILAAQVSDEANCAFNESFRLTLDGHLNIDALESAWRTLLDRHDALRMSLTPAGDRLRIDRRRSIPIEQVDLTDHAPETQEELLETLISAEGTQPFDLVHSALLRAQLITLAQERHLLVVTAHHLICDVWSVNVIVNELGKLYSAVLRDVSAELPAAIPFSQYATEVQSEAWRQQEILDLAYWKQRLTPQPELLTLPSERSRPSTRSFSGSTFIAEFPKEFSAALRKTGASAGCTLFTTLLAGWQILLWRLSGNADPVTMIPTAVQSQMEDKVLVGDCVHLLPIHTTLDPEMRAADYLRALKAIVLDAHEHQNATYGTIVRELAASREPGRLPLSEIQFNLEQVGPSASFDGLQARVRANGKQAVNFDIFLNIVDTGSGLRLECDYSTALYDESTIARWLGCYRTLLEGMVADSAQTIAMLPILEPALREQLEACNATANEPLAADSVPALIAQAFAAMPSQPAADFYGMELSRNQLAEQSDRLAAWLMRNGGGPGSLVGIYMDRSLEMLVAMLGVMKAGAAYVPLDPIFPPARIEQIVEETRVPVMITLSHHLEALPKSNAKVIALDTEADTLASEPLTTLPRIPADARAYVIFTSGSTGRPKGVEVTHGSVVNLLTDLSQRLEMKPADRLLAVTTLSFDIAVLEMMLPLVSGGTVAIADRDDIADGARLVELLKATRTTVLQATPVTWRMLLEQGFQCEPGFKMLCGGEAWTPAIADQLLGKQAGSGSRLWNMYGPTETTVWSSVTEVKRGASRMTIGPPMANTRFYVLDARFQPVVPGVSGELFIAGAGVARGYYERPELTAEKFLNDPFVPAERMYRTGDEVRQLPDGRIEFLGRLDQQVKLRGFRIELGDIETAMRALPGVRDAVAILRPDANGEAILIGYYIGAENRASTELRQALSSQLPAYMIPTVLKQLESLPLTPNGKIDRRALPDARPAKQEKEEEFLEPVAPTEAVLAEIFAEVLGCGRIGIRTSLFERGADSLGIFQIASRAYRKGLAVTAKQLMQLHTVQAVAAALDSMQGNANISLASSGAARVGLAPIDPGNASGVSDDGDTALEKPALSQAEQDILKIWKQLFKVEDLNAQSDFFDLGGHSLLLARLQIAIKKKFKVQLAAADVFRQPTIATLAVWLEHAQSAAQLAIDLAAIKPAHNPRIVPIQPSGTGRPIFVISQSMIFRTLAAELGTDQPVYAVQMLEQDAAAMQSATFEELVDFYIRLLREVQPNGPYRLAGWCVSAWIAYGVARQLEKEGAEVEMLMVIDSWAPAYFSGQPHVRRKLMIAVYEVQRSRWIGRRLRQASASQSRTSIERCLRGCAAMGEKIVARFQSPGVPPDPRKVEEAERLKELQSTARYAALTGPLQGRILLFRSEEEPTGPLLAPDMGWARLLGHPAQVELLPGDHHQIFDLAGARMMALSVRKLLNAAPPRLMDSVMPSGANPKHETQNLPLVEA